MLTGKGSLVGVLLGVAGGLALGKVWRRHKRSILSILRSPMSGMRGGTGTAYRAGKSVG